jgi:replicative DNA helicase
MEQYHYVDKSLPFDLDAERATLGSMLLQRDAIIAVDGWLAPDHFYLEQHAWVYEAMVACYRRRVPPDLATISDELRRRDQLELIGGLPYLIELANAVPTAVHVEYYGRIVERTAVLRRLIGAGGQIAALGFVEDDELAATLDRAQAALDAVATRPGANEFVPLRDVADDYFAYIQARTTQGVELVGVPTGYVDLDAVLGGLARGAFHILAARPGVGKTALSLSIAYNAARQGHRVGIVSLEMSREQLGQRLLAMHTGLDLQRLRLGQVRDAELPGLLAALAELAELPIAIEDTAGQTVAELRAKARRLQAKGGLDLLIVDYIQLLQGANAREGRVQEVSAISRGLANLARELDVPLLALSQLSRNVEGRATHVPMLSDLRDSGSLEQDASVVMFIYREELYDRESDKQGIAEIHIAKHRQGPTGVVPLRFDAATTRFGNLAHYTSMEGY